ncbi:MAG: hypothetical protein H0U52_02715 [Chloroflexi bacterium]|nr:hypothetical protein [Chloroflexota bacterium]
MLATDAAAAAATWRPQLYGDQRSRRIEDPIVEPLWTGPRILAFAGDGDVRLTGAEGALIEDQPTIAAALADAAAGATLLVEAFLTSEPLQAVAEIARRDVVATPKPADAVTQMVLGNRGERKGRLADRQAEARQRTIDGADERLALVAVDLLWLDDESLCDVPLLERKRILESVLTESDLVRVGVHVKPPIDAWLGSWRSFGFRRISFKAANSRYLPGQKNQDWSQAEIPHR